MPTGFPMFNVVVVVLFSFLNKRHSYAVVSLFMISFFILIRATSSDKNNWDSLYFHKKIHKKTLGLLKVTQNPPSPWLNVVPSLKKPCKAMKTRNEQPICNQHWIRGQGRRVSQFLWLIVVHKDVFFLTLLDSWWLLKYFCS